VVSLALATVSLAGSCQTVTDCTDEIARAAEASTGGFFCYTVTCANGECGLASLSQPSGFTPGACNELRCKQISTGVYEWAVVPTAESKKCADNQCYAARCDPLYGCMHTDICTNQTDDCYRYVCDEQQHACVGRNLMQEFECAKEVCKDGKKYLEEKNLTEACPTTDKCLVARCVDGSCSYEPKLPPGDDPCQKYSCNHETGDWDISPRCTSPDFCHTAECTVFGECRQIPVDCSDAYNITGDCASLRCKSLETSYKCVIELAADTALDVCYRCIAAGEETYEELADQTNLCYELDCSNAIPAVVKTEEAQNWEKKTNGCLQYQCANDTGFIVSRGCSSGDVCVDGYSCSPKEKLLEGNWAVAIGFSAVSFATTDMQTILSVVSTLVGNVTSSVKFGVELDEDGNITSLDVFVSDESTANAIAAAVKQIPSGPECQFDFLCARTTIDVEAAASSTGASTSTSTGSSTTNTSTNSSSSGSTDISAASVVASSAFVALAMVLFALAH